MDIIKTLGLVCFTGVFLLVYIAVMAAFAIVGTQAKQQQTRRILKAQASGAFADLELPKNKFRFRLLAVVALFGLLGMTASIAILALQMATEFSDLYWVTIIAILVFGSIGAVAGLMMNREINRRL